MLFFLCFCLVSLRYTLRGLEIFPFPSLEIIVLVAAFDVARLWKQKYLKMSVTETLLQLKQEESLNSL